MFLQDLLQGLSTSDVLRLGLAGLIIHIITITVYSLYFHPLSKYPGPFWARVSSFPSWWHGLKKDRHIWLFDLHEKYGTTVRYRPDSVVINTPSAFRTIYGPKGNNKKGLPYRAWPRDLRAPSTIQTIDNYEHGRKRRILNMAFSDKALRSFEPRVQANVDRWCELLAEEIPEGGDWSSSVNVADWVNWLVFDVMGDLCLGRSFEMKEKNSNMRYIIELMASMMEFMYPIAISPFAPLWIWLKPRGLDALLEIAMPSDTKLWWAWLEGVLTERTKVEEAARRDGTEGPKDFFHYLYQIRDPETGGMGYSQPELWEELQLLVIAGADTTAIVLAATFFYLIREPEVLDKLSDELLTTFDSAAEIVPGAKLASCRYLRAAIREGLRMSPPVSAELIREVLPGGSVVDGEVFPEGVNVSVCTWAISYNEEIFPEPYRYRPERWLLDQKEGGSRGSKTGVSKASLELAESAQVSFSFGARNCVGKNLAWMEMSLLLAKALYHFEIRRDPDSNLGGGDPNGVHGRRNPDQYQLHDTFVALRDGPLIQVKKRAST